jgi:hypothetical protein
MDAPNFTISPSLILPIPDPRNDGTFVPRFVLKKATIGLTTSGVLTTDPQSYAKFLIPPNLQGPGQLRLDSQKLSCGLAYKSTSQYSIDPEVAAGWLMGTGVVALLVGAVLLGVGTAKDDDKGLLTAGGITMGGGAVLMITGFLFVPGWE